MNAALQVTAAAAAGACGILVSWSVGREFAEGTVSGLFALPVSRTVIAAAKLIAFAAWSTTVALALISALFIAGVLAGFGPLPRNGGEIAVRLLVLVLATAGVTLAAAWVATLTRGLLGGIAATVVLLASAQVVVFSGGGAWYPPSAPALWALDPTPTTAVPLAGALAVGGVFAVLTLLSWRRMELDR
nr:ABC transporter permease [Leifsonia soli]